MATMTSNLEVDRSVWTASRSRSNLTLDQVLSGVFDDDRAFWRWTSEEEGEGIYAYSGKPTVEPGDIVALGKAVTTEAAAGEGVPAASTVGDSARDREEEEEECLARRNLIGIHIVLLPGYLAVFFIGIYSSCGYHE